MNKLFIHDANNILPTEIGFPTLDFGKYKLKNKNNNNKIKKSTKINKP